MEEVIKDNVNRLEQLILSDDFGNGSSNLSPYNTAWVARIPDPEKPDQPIFYDSYEWVRQNQLKDGSWGATKPYFIFDRIISTLVSVICLKQWNFKQDENIIEKGICFLKLSIDQLNDFEALKFKMPAGFELIFPVLMDELAQMNVNLGFEGLVQFYRSLRKEKLKSIRNFENVEIKGAWRFSLEALADIFTNEDMKKMISKDNHMIMSSYSSTAFALFRGVESDSTIKILNSLIEKNKGGIPSFRNMKIFDLAWSIQYCIWSGYPILSCNMSRHIKKLKQIYIDFNGKLNAEGSSDEDGLPPDADDIANTLFVLYSAKEIMDIKSLKPLLEFYLEEKGHFKSFDGEKKLSLSTNLNCLNLLGCFKNDNKIKLIGKNMIDWMIPFNREYKYDIPDKWHISQYYSNTRALFAFEMFDSTESENIYQYLIGKQNDDGGWGDNAQSTSTETGMVVIAICYWYNKCHKGNIITENVLKKAKEFLSINNEIEHDQWINKVLYSMVNVDATILACAEYALLRTLGLGADSY